MSRSPTIAVAGVGAVGTLIAYRLAAAGCPITLVARGRRAAQLSKDGLRLDDGPALFAPVVQAKDLETHDILILAVKEGGLAAILKEITPALRADTLVIPLVNGLPFWFDAARQHAIVAPIVGAVTYVMASMNGDGVVKSGSMERLVLGLPDGSGDERVARIAAILSSARVMTRVSDDIRSEVWAKVALNLATNPLSVLTGADLQTHFRDDGLAAIVTAILQETIAVARAAGTIPSMTIDEMLATGRKAGPAKTSMLQDHLEGRPLELDGIAHSCLALAERVGVEMPVTEAIVRLVQFGTQYVHSERLHQS